MTKPKPNPQPKLSYYYLLDDADVKRWYDNVARGSLATAAVWLRRMGFIHKNFGKTPEDLAKMSSKEAGNFMLDAVSSMEKSAKRGGYISSFNHYLNLPSTPADKDRMKEWVSGWLVSSSPLHSLLLGRGDSDRLICC